MTGSVAHRLDVRGLLCVHVLLRLRPVVDVLQPGAVVEVVTDDPAAPLDLPAWCHLTGHHYLGPVESEPDSVYRVAVGLDSRTVDRVRPWTVRDATP